MAKQGRRGHEPFLEQVYQAPDDDAPRLVYADWLQQRGDPLGELIALQIERVRAKARSGGRQRETELLDEHIRSWTVGLDAEDAWVKIGDSYGNRPDVEFRRGFPAVVRTKKINRRPVWGTVTHCNVPPHEDGCRLGALRAITEATNEDIIALSKLRVPLAVEELVWGWPHDPKRAHTEAAGPTVDRKHETAFCAISVLPKLRRLELSAAIVGALPSPRTLDWIWSSPLMTTVEELMIPGWELAAWLRAATPTRLRRFELAAPALNPYGWQAGTRLIVERGDRAFASATALIYRSSAASLRELARVFGELDKGTLESARIAIPTKAEWDATATERAALARVLKGRGIAATIEKASR